MILPTRECLRVAAFCGLFLSALTADGSDLTDVVRAVAKERGDAAEPSDKLSETPISPTPAHLSTLRPLLAVEGNPWLARLVGGARDYLSRPETAADWPKLDANSAPGFFVLQGSSDRDPRSNGARLEALFWLFAHPDSPLHHDPEVLKRFLRRAHAYTEGIEFTAAAGKLQAGQVLLDDFAIAPASGALREFATLYPGLLLSAQRAQWDRALRLAADAMMGKAAGRPGRYANIDLALSVELLNFGLYFNDEKLLARSRELFSAQAANILPDGGTHYIGSQNESPGYHNVVTQFITRTYEITGDPAALEMLKRLEWYGPVSVGRRGEYWTSPSWKHTWNGGEFATGGESIVGITGNPWVRGMLVPPVAAPPWKGWESARAAVPWWRSDVVARPLPDNYVLLDRNIAGPRGWFGRFNYAATMRDIPENESGHTTLLGAQFTGEKFSPGVLLMGIYPRVYLGGDRANPRSFAWLTSGLRSDLAMGRTWSAFAASYQMHVFGSSMKGKLVPWLGRQLWLTLPDRVVGVLDIAPESGAIPAASVEGLVRLGTGGTVSGPAQKLVSTGPGRYTFGDLLVQIHASDYAITKTEETPFRLPKAPYADLVLQNPQPVAGSRRFVVEIRPASVTPDARVEVVERDGLSGLQVRVEQKKFKVWYNPRPQSISMPETKEALDPGRIRVFVKSSEPADLAPAWANFSELSKPRDTTQ